MQSVNPLLLEVFIQDPAFVKTWASELQHLSETQHLFGTWRLLEVLPCLETVFKLSFPQSDYCGIHRPLLNHTTFYSRQNTVWIADIVLYTVKY